MHEKFAWKSADVLTQTEGLPDPFMKSDGTRINSPDEWPEQRAYLKSMLSHYMYGDFPPTPNNTKGTVLSAEYLYEGRALKEKTLIECGPDHMIKFLVYVIRPNKPGLYPTIVYNAFSLKQFSPDMLKSMGITETDESGMMPSPAEKEAVCERDYCIVMLDSTQLATDEPDSKGSIYEAYPDQQWKTMAIWAWAQMRVIDYLETTEYADTNQIISAGHSRFGKAALCASIYDERIALCAAMGSGCGGAGCYRILGGKDGFGKGYQETLGAILTMFPHWFSDELGRFSSAAAPDSPVIKPDFSSLSIDGKVDFSKYYEYMVTKYPLKNESRLPFDLHTVRALIAPRLLITSDGLDDEWANPYGAQISWTAAKEVYKFLGAEKNCVLHFREGGHSFNAEDWTVLLDFADHTLRNFHSEYKYPINNMPYVDAPPYYSWCAPGSTKPPDSTK